VRTLESIDPETGELLWRRVLPNVERLLGIAEKRLIVQTRGAILAVEPKDGMVAWRHPTRDPLVAQLCGPQVVYSRRITWVPSKNLRVPELVWLDADTGREVASQPIPEMQDDWPRFAALIRTNGRLWGIFGRGDERSRLLAELTPAGPVRRLAPDEPPNVWHSDGSRKNGRRRISRENLLEISGTGVLECGRLDNIRHVGRSRRDRSCASLRPVGPPRLFRGLEENACEFWKRFAYVPDHGRALPTTKASPHEHTHEKTNNPLPDRDFDGRYRPGAS
jgi:hypothetical protein